MTPAITKLLADVERPPTVDTEGACDIVEELEGQRPVTANGPALAYPIQAHRPDAALRGRRRHRARPSALRAGPSARRRPLAATCLKKKPPSERRAASEGSRISKVLAF